MKYVFALSIFLISAHYATAQSIEATDTVVVNMLNHSTGERDTSRVRFDRDVQRFFNRNLRAPFRGTEVETGYASLSFVINQQGKALDPQCTSMTNKPIGQEAMRVAKKLSSTHVEPLYMNGKPVVAKVNINICFTNDKQFSTSKEDIESKAAIIVIAYSN